jgi:hypothetical protein
VKNAKQTESYWHAVSFIAWPRKTLRIVGRKTVDKQTQTKPR